MDHSTVYVIGGSGFIGQELSGLLHHAAYRIIIVSRNKNNIKTLVGKEIEVMSFSDFLQSEPQENYVIINLAGENLARSRWTSAQKEKIIRSRVDTTKSLVNFVENAPFKPRVFIQGSAIGFYDNKSGNLSHETSPKGNGFLADLVETWEQTALAIENFSRLCIVRTGVVLGKTHGIIPQFVKQYKYFAGGTIGSGRQWISWIHLQDEVRAIKYLMEDPGLHGIFNLVAPESVQMKTFGKSMAKALRRPHWLPVPSFMIKYLFGEMGENLILSGERVVPEKLQDTGFTFSYPHLNSALKNLLSNS